MAKPRGVRQREQRERQNKVRVGNKTNKKPSRDDFARYFLWWAITETAEKQSDAAMHQLEMTLIDGVVAQGFDRKAAGVALDDLIEKYTRLGWDFRIKRHLQSGPPDTVAD